MTLYVLLLPFIHYPLTSILKPIALLLLIAGAWQSKLPAFPKRLLILSLGCSTLGDIALTMPASFALLLGLLLFLIAHCFYIILFLQNSYWQTKRFLAFFPVLTVVSLAFYMLLPVLGALTFPTTFYICILTTMVFTAFHVNQQAGIIITGACLFLLSDLILAIGEFLQKTNQDKITLLTMSIYYLAQFLLVTGLCSQTFSSPKKSLSAI